jgi:CubicO group peptidase (beta-lactamase class C family)
MARYKLPGMSIAITKNECLVYAPGYGYANKKCEPAHANHLFRVASVSNPITSISIMKLIEQGKFNLDSRVFGRRALIGTTYGTTPYSSGSGISNIRIRDLLEYRSGWSNTGGDPMFMNFTTHTQVMDFMIDNRPLMATPGTGDEYLNFGYTVLGRVIEKVTGMSYQNDVKRKILNPAGVSKMKIAASLQNNKAAGEVVYYPSSAYNLKPAYMDAHGGWIASAIDLARLKGGKETRYTISFND